MERLPEQGALLPELAPVGLVSFNPAVVSYSFAVQRLIYGTLIPQIEYSPGSCYVPDTYNALEMQNRIRYSSVF